MFPQSVSPHIKVNHPLALCYQVDLTTITQQRDAHTERVCASYSYHVALTPHLKLQGAVQLKMGVKKLENHQHTSGTTGEFGSFGRSRVF